MKKRDNLFKVILALSMTAAVCLVTVVSSYAGTITIEDYNNCVGGSYAITLNGRSVTGPAVTFSENDDVVITAIADDNYEFNEWITYNAPANQGSGNVYSFKATNDDGESSLSAGFSFNGTGWVPPSPSSAPEETPVNPGENENAAPTSAPTSAPTISSVPSSNPTELFSQQVTEEINVNVNELPKAVVQMPQALNNVVGISTTDFSSFKTYEGLSNGLSKLVKNEVAAIAKSGINVNNASSPMAVSFFTKDPISFNVNVLNAICQNDIDVVYTFMYKGHMYMITIPKGTKPEDLLNNGKAEGPFFIGRKLGTTQQIN